MASTRHICSYMLIIVADKTNNSAMLWYLLWRVVTGRHHKIKLSFLITGHTKFSPDCGFGLIKRLYRGTKVNTLADFQKVMNDSSVMTVAQPCGNEAGYLTVPSSDWTNHLANFFKKLPGIKKFHHFTFYEDGRVGTQLFSDTAEMKVQLLKVTLPLPATLPKAIQPPGLDSTRQWHLYNEISEFVSEEHRDTVAPLPSLPQQQPQPPIFQEEPQPEEEPVPPLTKVRKKGRGGKGGSK